MRLFGRFRVPPCVYILRSWTLWLQILLISLCPDLLPRDGPSLKIDNTSNITHDTSLECEEDFFYFSFSAYGIEIIYSYTLRKKILLMLLASNRFTKDMIHVKLFYSQMCKCIPCKMLV